jgi:hypothetical protein
MGLMWSRCPWWSAHDDHCSAVRNMASSMISAARRSTSGKGGCIPPGLSVSQAHLQGTRRYPVVGADRRRAASSIVQHDARARLWRRTARETGRCRTSGDRGAVLLAEDVLPAPVNNASEFDFGLLAGTMRFK